jgi:hypothetical protein
MMHLRLVFLALVASSLGLVASLASAMVAPSTRTIPVAVSPAPNALALVELDFGRPPSGRLDRATLRASVHGMFGDDYLALATPRQRPRGHLLALVLVINRPSPLADPVTVHVALRASRALGLPRVVKLKRSLGSSTIVRHGGDGMHACAIAHAGAAVEGSALTTLGSRGTPLAGFDAAGAVAAAYDSVCGLPYPPAFKEDIEPAKSCEGAGCTPPQPVEPEPRPPGCTPCDPRPGTACPLAARPDICVNDGRFSRAH